MTISTSGALRGSQGRVGKIIVNFIEFHIKCSNEYIFVLPLANLIFRGYVRSGRWVGEVSQTKVRVRKNGKYTCEKGDTRVRIKGAAEKLALQTNINRWGITRLCIIGQSAPLQRQKRPKGRRDEETRNKEAKKTTLATFFGPLSLRPQNYPPST